MTSLALLGRPVNGLHPVTALEVRALDMMAEQMPSRTYVRLVLSLLALGSMARANGGAGSRFVVNVVVAHGR